MPQFNHLPPTHELNILHSLNFLIVTKTLLMMEIQEKIGTQKMQLN